VFDSSLHSIGREHTVTVALLVAALIFIPALAVVSRPWSYSPAIGCSVLCVTLAWFNWKKSRTVAVAPSTEGKAAE
jgi:hypothetical protein